MTQMAIWWADFGRDAARRIGRVPQPHARPAIVSIDELDACIFERAADGLIVGPGERNAATHTKPVVPIRAAISQCFTRRPKHQRSRPLFGPTSVARPVTHVTDSRDWES